MILPAGEINYIGPVIDSRTGNVLIPGTESVLRAIDDQINVELTIAGASVSITDDALSIGIETASPEDAIKPVTDLVNRLLLVLSFGLGHLITMSFIQATDADGRRVRFRSEYIDRFATYNLDAVRAALGNVPQHADRAATDGAIATALQYFAKGLALEQLIVTNEVSAIRPLGSATALLASEVYLNYWKVLEMIVGGDTASGAFRRRVGQLGLPLKATLDELGPLYDLRDAADVAHAQRAQPPVDMNQVARVKAVAHRVLSVAMGTP